MNASSIRRPDAYAVQDSERTSKKWKKILSLFMQNDVAQLTLAQRTGARGRILSVLAQEAFRLIEIPLRPSLFSFIKRPIAGT